jgi:uncharacterized membrane protein
MKKILDETQQDRIEKLIGQFELKTKSELSIIIAKSSDPYPAASLRFGILATFFTSLIALSFYELSDQALIPVVCLLLIIIFSFFGQIPFFKKFTLSKMEMRREVKEKAIELFFSNIDSQTSHQNHALLYISLTERVVEFLVGKEIKEKIDQSEINSFVDGITSHFKEDDYFTGIKLSIETWLELLSKKLPQDEDKEHKDELTKKIIWI